MKNHTIKKKGLSFHECYQYTDDFTSAVYNFVDKQWSSGRYSLLARAKTTEFVFVYVPADYKVTHPRRLQFCENLTPLIT